MIIFSNPIFGNLNLSFQHKKKGEEAGLLEQVKSQICDNVSLFAQNYSEDFADYLPRFVTSVWNLLVTTSIETKYDMVFFSNFFFLSGSISFLNFFSSWSTLAC